jgi:hypothetical protein
MVGNPGWRHKQFYFKRMAMMANFVVVRAWTKSGLVREV